MTPERPSPLTIREATPADAALLAELGAKSFSGAFSAFNSAEDMAAYLAASFGPEIQAAELRDPKNLFLLAESDGVAVGYASLSRGAPLPCVRGPRSIRLWRLYVLQEWLGSGAGRGLMRACIERAAREGAGSLWLAVWDQNERALAFYRRWGFRVVGTTEFVLGSTRDQDFVMELELGSSAPA